MLGGLNVLTTSVGGGMWWAANVSPCACLPACAACMHMHIWGCQLRHMCACVFDCGATALPVNGRPAAQLAPPPPQTADPHCMRLTGATDPTALRCTARRLHCPLQLFAYELAFCDRVDGSFQLCPPGESWHTCPSHFDCYVQVGGWVGGGGAGAWPHRHPCCLHDVPALPASHWQARLTHTADG